MVSVVSVYQSGFQILIQDAKNYLHLRGNNSHDQPLIEVFNNLAFKLQHNESVLQFKSNPKGIVIHTSERLFMLYHQQSDHPNLIEFPIPNTTFSNPGKAESENYVYKLSAQELFSLEFEPNISPRVQSIPIPPSIHKLNFSFVKSVVIGKNIKILVTPNQILVHEFISYPDKKQTLYDTLPLILSLFLHNCYNVKIPIISTDHFVTSDLLCIRYKTSYHVILPEITNTGIKYIRFEWKSTIKKDQIFWDKINDNLYVKDDTQNIYIYDIKTRQLELSFDPQIPYPFSKSFNNPSLSEITNINYVYNKPGFDTQLILHCDPNVSFGYKKYDRITIINTSGLKYYGVVNDRFAYIANDKLNILNTNTDELVVKPVDLPCLESSITKSVIDITITIETIDAIYYSYLFDISNKFCFAQINRIIKQPLTSGINHLEEINPTYRLSGRSREDSSEYFNINHKEFILEDILTRISKIDVYKRHTICFGTGLKWASGGGAKRMAINFMLKKFADKYLITHNFMTSLNIDTLSKCSDATLANMGKFLLFCYNAIGRLTIRLPLLLIAAIQRRFPTIATLELFAKNEDHEAFNRLLKIKHSKSELVESGIDNYVDGLNFISNFDIQYGSNICIAYDIAKKIANGFLFYMKSSFYYTFETNLITFDLCLSGDYEINIKSFISRIYFSGRITESQRQLLIRYIENLTQPQLRKLLINWTGTSVIKTKFIYQIFITFSEATYYVHYSNCSRTIYIHETLFEIIPIEEWNCLFLDECMHVSG